MHSLYCVPLHITLHMGQTYALNMCIPYHFNNTLSSVFHRQCIFSNSPKISQCKAKIAVERTATENKMKSLLSPMPLPTSQTHALPIDKNPAQLLGFPSKASFVESPLYFDVDDDDDDDDNLCDDTVFSAGNARRMMRITSVVRDVENIHSYIRIAFCNNNLLCNSIFQDMDSSFGSRLRQSSPISRSIPDDDEDEADEDSFGADQFSNLIAPKQRTSIRSSITRSVINRRESVASQVANLQNEMTWDPTHLSLLRATIAITLQTNYENLMDRFFKGLSLVTNAKYVVMYFVDHKLKLLTEVYYSNQKV